jgi:hypothetical protein
MLSRRSDVPTFRASGIFSWNVSGAMSLTKQQAIEMLESDDLVDIGMEAHPMRGLGEKQVPSDKAGMRSHHAQKARMGSPREV